MTYLVRRGAAWHFRYRLPDDLRGLNVPKHWPRNLDRLVNQKEGKLKHEITESLRTIAKELGIGRGSVYRALAEGNCETIPTTV